MNDPSYVGRLRLDRGVLSGVIGSRDFPEGEAGAQCRPIFTVRIGPRFLLCLGDRPLNFFSDLVLPILDLFRCGGTLLDELRLGHLDAVAAVVA